jgi:hypothetical protein
MYNQCEMCSEKILWIEKKCRVKGILTVRSSLEGRICTCRFVPGVIHVVQDILEVVAHDDGSL